MKHANVRIKSWVELDTAFKSLQGRPTALPRMMLVEGVPGLGKTTAVDWIAGKYQGVYMVASSTWSQRSLLERLADRLGLLVKKSHRGGQILDLILQELDRRPLDMIVIDEFDRVAHKPAIVELVREIYDVSDVPIALVGMANIYHALSGFPQLQGRIGQRVEFRPIDKEDARAVTDALCEVAVTADLLEAVWKRTAGNIRLLTTELADLEIDAARLGIETIGITDIEG